jgi:FHA domain
MIDQAISQLIADGWIFAGLRILFIGLIYLFLFLVLRNTVRELNLAARRMSQGEGRASELRLLVLEGAQSSLRPGEVINLGQRNDIGRDAGSTIKIDDPHVSAKHAELRFERGQWWLRDHGSSNGTTINGEPVRAVVGVRAGDVIQCAGVRFRLIPSFPVPGEDASA